MRMLLCPAYRQDRDAEILCSVTQIAPKTMLKFRLDQSSTFFCAENDMNSDTREGVRHECRPSGTRPNNYRRTQHLRAGLRMAAVVYGDGRPRFPESTPLKGIRIRSQRPEKLPHPLDAAIEFLLGGRVRQPDMLAGAETFAGNRDHVGLVQQAPGNIGGGPNAAPSKERAHVRIHVERPVRPDTAHAWNSSKAGEHMLGEVGVAQSHFADAVLRPGQCRDSGFLDDGSRSCSGLA